MGWKCATDPLPRFTGFGVNISGYQYISIHSAGSLKIFALVIIQVIYNDPPGAGARGARELSRVRLTLPARHSSSTIEADSTT